MKTATLQGQFSLRCLDQRIKDKLSISKKKMLIGSSENCDFVLEDRTISSMHAFLYVEGELLRVLDLYSESGVFVNGSRVREATVFSGDTLTIGNMSFSVETVEELDAPVFNPDQDIQGTAYESHVEIPPKEGLVFIDGEYCDIVFDDSGFKPLTEIPKIYIDGDYIDLDESVPTLEISYPVADKRLEVISYINGLMMDIKYINLKDGEFYLSPMKESKSDVVFHSVEKTQIFSVTNKELKFYATDRVTPSVAWDQINLGEGVFLTNGVEQVSLRLVDKATGWRTLPAFYRDKEFLKQGSKVFAGVFLPMLLLLFVTIPKNEDIEDQIAVVYKLPEKVSKPTEAMEKSELSAKEITSKTENTGHKETQQPDSRVEFAQASKQQKVVAKATAPTAAPAAKAVKTPPVKAYEFKSSVAFNSLVGDAPTVNTKGSQSKSAIQDTKFNTGSSDTGALVAGADIGVSKFNGSDKKGSGSASYGSRGLASKAGFDSAYLEPKTVVLGSMDPELLRKILREYIPQFRHCYQQELIAHSEKIKGVIDLNFTISASGKVSKYNIKVKDARFSKQGVGCMGQVLGLIDFPKPKGGGVVDVRQPLNFFAETEKI